MAIRSEYGLVQITPDDMDRATAIMSGGLTKVKANHYILTKEQVEALDNAKVPYKIIEDGGGSSWS
jgi:hypothetical protein